MCVCCIDYHHISYVIYHISYNIEYRISYIIYTIILIRKKRVKPQSPSISQFKISHNYLR